MIDVVVHQISSFPGATEVVLLCTDPSLSLLCNKIVRLFITSTGTAIQTAMPASPTSDEHRICNVLSLVWQSINLDDLQGCCFALHCGIALANLQMRIILACGRAQTLRLVRCQVW